MLQDYTVGMATPKAISTIIFCEGFPDFFWLMSLEWNVGIESVWKIYEI